ncbi:GntR family transcriptional regulator, partial [Kribbella sp. DT2]|uniref:GntR family transcriptional regulator n=1 Tax=Kribbella sp. DT2 TaxID=3393427 RepID=UPI003CEF2AA8
MSRSNQGEIGRSITAGSDFLQLSTVGVAPGGLSTWLADELRAAIADGRLPLGSRLPPSRVLAADLQVSRGVVTEAYQRLTEDGHTTAKGRAGTTVVAIPLNTQPAASLPSTRPGGGGARPRGGVREPGHPRVDPHPAAPPALAPTP